MKAKLSSTFVVGFAVFAMLFGAGNLVFPPYLGMQSKSNWMYGFLGFAVMDVVLAVLVMNVIAGKKDGADGIVGIMGNHLSKLLMLTLYICIGPLVAIPRTAATTYELSIAPLAPQINSVVFSIIFFGIVLVLCIRPSKIIDIIGAVLAPILLVTLGVLIVKGILNPLGSIADGGALYTSVHTGITTGYQTMDAIAALAFSILIIAQVKDYKLKNISEERKMIRHACYIAGAALILIYGGLAYLGASVSEIYPKNISRTDIIINLAKDILGPAGLVILAVIVAAACLTTAIGLVSSCATYLEKLTEKKVSYKVFCTLVCVFSAFLCNVGLDNIIALAAPILDFIYPILLVLIFLATMKESVVSRAARYGAITGVILFVTAQAIENITHVSSIIATLPLASYGFAWMLPAVAGMIIGALIGKLVPAREAMGYGN